ncbi:MAG: hypothetical protein E7597_00350 [Ruminococcaceae bacterium]|nr:hypothetical protein [Oscillospiraceae bacterium]
MKTKIFKILAVLLCICFVFCSCEKQSGKDYSSSASQFEESEAEQSFSKEDSEESVFESSYESGETIESKEEIVSEDSSSGGSVSAFAQSKFFGMETLNYVALGDSIARGYGLENPEKECYPARLTKALTTVLEGTTVNYTNYAVDGMTTQGLIELLENGADAIDSADLITICIGANNLLHNFLEVVEKHMPSMVSSSGSVSQNEMQSSAFVDAVKAIQAEVESEEFAVLMNEGVEQLKVDLVYIIEELNRRAPNADIVITTVYSPYNGIRLSLPYLGIDFDMGAVSDRWVSALDAEIIRIAREKNCTLVEAYEPFEDKGGLVNAALSFIPFNFNFDPHPNLKGHIELSNLHLTAIKEIE